MKKLLLTSGLMLATANASAATIDFLTAGNIDERGASQIVLSDVAGSSALVSVTATANGNPAFAYLDGNDAGLGVCKTLNGDQCNPGDDDNLQHGERLFLNFTNLQNTAPMQVNITSMDFKNSGHGTSWASGSVAHYTVDGGSEQTFNLAGTVAFNETGTDFSFYLHDNDPDAAEFYIKSIDFDNVGTVTTVPIPAAAWLFASGLIGLVGVSRRKV